MKDLLLYVYVVFKTINLEISLYFEDYATRAARLFFLIQSIRLLFSRVVVAVVVV